MSVSKRNGSKYFYIQFQYNGKTYIKSSKTPDKQLALNLEAQWRKQLIEQNQLGLKSPIEITKGFQLFINSKSHSRVSSTPSTGVTRLLATLNTLYSSIKSRRLKSTGSVNCSSPTTIQTNQSNT